MTSLKRITVYVMILAVISAFAAGKHAYGDGDAQLNNHASCAEVWAYLMRGEENELKGDEPITDLCLFCRSVDISGRLRGRGPEPRKMKLPAGARTHLVLACQNSTLLHFLLDPDYPLRAAFMEDVREASKDFDGIQIDFEGIPAADRDRFTALTGELKRVLADKILSVALPARITGDGGAYDYTAIASSADRVIVMAYDEHWSGSSPGPVASLPWCERVARYALGKVPRERIVMGIPFYGRAWQNSRNSRALKFRTTAELLGSLDMEPGREGGEHPSFTYRDMVTVTVYYEDVDSLHGKVAMYGGLGLDRVGFWRISQEPREFWQRIQVSRGDTALSGAVSSGQ